MIDNEIIPRAASIYTDCHQDAMAALECAEELEPRYCLCCGRELRDTVCLADDCRLGQENLRLEAADAGFRYTGRWWA